MLGIFQLAIAAALILGIADRVPAIARRLFAAELSQDPDDFIASRLLALAGRMPGSNLTFYEVYFTAHGLLHIGVVSLLLYGHAWAYPSAVLVLMGFVVYQTVEWFAVGGPMLLVLSAIDLLVIGLTFMEWRRKTT